jgi:hypothetical protein
MGARMKIKVISVMFFIMCLMPFSQAAHFVCGEVNNADDGTAGGWREMTIYPVADNSKTTTCQISPEGNKYCCDSENIDGYTWVIGDVIGAKIIDSGDGYYADEVSVVTTGEGYDSLPDVQLKHVIEIDYSLSEDNTSITFNIQTSNNFTSEILYSLNDASQIILCNDCNSASVDVDELEPGDYDFKVIAKNNLDDSRKKIVSFSVNQPISQESNEENQEDLNNDLGGISSSGGSISIREDSSLVKYSEVNEKPIFYISDSEDDFFKQLIIWTNKKLSDVKLKVEERDISDEIVPKGTLLKKFFEVKTHNINSEDLKEIMIEFKIPIKELEEKNLGPEDIMIASYNSVELNDVSEITYEKEEEYYRFIIKDSSLNSYVLFALDKEVSLSEKEEKQTSPEKQKVFNLTSEERNSLIPIGILLLMSVIIFIIFSFPKKKKN